MLVISELMLLIDNQTQELLHRKVMTQMMHAGSCFEGEKHKSSSFQDTLMLLKFR